MDNKPSMDQAEGAKAERGFAGYESARRDLFAIFDRLECAPGDSLSAEARQEIGSLRRKFAESRFYLVFLGQFKRGKTTLINSMLSTELLPTGVLPLTSIVTIVQHGPESSARVRFSNGKTAEIPMEILDEYVTEKGNPRNEKEVAEVEVSYPAAILEGGLCLVDTPGIGSIFEHNTQVAYDFVPKADAGIFVFSPESPLSQTELDFLRHVREYVGKIFFVLNKADQVTEAEREDILEFARQAIRKQMPEGAIRLSPVSARQFLEGRKSRDVSTIESSRIPQLFQTVMAFISAHKGPTLVQSTAAALQRFVRNELLRLELEQRALATDVEQLQAKIETIENTWKALDQRHREAGYVLRGEIQALESKLERQLNGFAKDEAPGLIRYLQAKVREHSCLPKQEFARRMDEEVRNKIGELLEEWKLKEERPLEQEFLARTNRFSREAAVILGQIQQIAAEQFGFAWTPSSQPEPFKAELKFKVKIDEIITWGLTRLPLLLPRPLFIRYLGARMEHAGPEGLHRNVGRIRSDLAERLDASLNAFLLALDEQLHSAQDSVRRALRKAAEMRASSESRTGEIMQEHSAQVDCLRSIDEKLTSIRAPFT